jgi:hypothetical protein
MGPESETRDGGRKPVRDRIANAKILGWVIYAAGFAIWLFGYLSEGHAPLFDWNAATPWWISSFVPNFEAELGLALMFASVIPTLPWGPHRRNYTSTCTATNTGIAPVRFVCRHDRSMTATDAALIEALELIPPDHD